MNMILLSAFWYVIGAVSAVLFVDALRTRAKIKQINNETGHRKRERERGRVLP